MDSRLIFLHRDAYRWRDTLEYHDRIIGFAFFVRRGLLGKSGRLLSIGTQMDRENVCSNTDKFMRAWGRENLLRLYAARAYRKTDTGGRGE